MHRRSLLPGIARQSGLSILLAPGFFRKLSAPPRPFTQGSFAMRPPLARSLACPACSRSALSFAFSARLGRALAVIATLAAGSSIAPYAAAADAPGRSNAQGVVIAAQTLRPGIVLDERHVALARVAPGPGDLTRTADVLGYETQVAVYRGQPIRAGDLGPPTLIRRNELIRLSFKAGAILLMTEGRALDDGAKGERVRVMNLDSRRTVYGVVAGPGLVETQQ